jgi:REP element-mobilizing transposase RayT
MILNITGRLVDQLWENIDALHEHIELDNYIVMLNHIHGIIIINKNLGDINLTPPIQTFNVKNSHRTEIVDRTKMELSKIIQQFKRTVTLNIRKEKRDSVFKWQRSFYDRIIRNEKELFNIRNYIELNPLRWGLDNDMENLEL